jgi:hypothetical protein
MTASLYILHIVDDFGNQIRPCDLASYEQRYKFFKEANNV